MKKGWIHCIVILFFSLLLFHGCGKEEGGGLTVEQLISQGWTKFSAGNYAGARGDFNAANGLTTDTTEAYLGLGWAELRQSRGGLAEKAFVTYLAKVPNSIDAKAGLALAYHAQHKFQEAINTANTVLSSDPNWSLFWDNSINHLDLKLVLAHSYYAIGNFSQSLAVVRQYFDPGFDPDLGTDEGRAELAAKLRSLYTG